MPHRILGSIMRISMILFTLLIAMWMILQLNLWGGGLKDWFSRIGDIETLIYLTAFLMVMSMVFKYLLLWQVRAEYDVRHTKRRKR